MENKPIAGRLKLLAQLMELHEQNAFKIRSVANAAFKVDKLPFKLAGKSIEEMNQIDGIGKSISAYITELLDTGSIADLEDLLKATPDGVVEMLHIKGIGPKKVAIIWNQLGIENTGELYYACNENRLVEAKGFGIKTQDEIKRALEFRMASNGKFLYAQAKHEAHELMTLLKGMFPGALLEFAGDYRRCCDVISELNIVLGTRDAEMGLNNLSTSALLQNITVNSDHINGETANGLLVDIQVTEKRFFYLELFKATGSDDHVKAVQARLNDIVDQPDSEEFIYKKASLPWIPPELREGDSFMNKAILPDLIDVYDLKGSIHNHSTWSDGINTLKEMALYCRDEMKLEYLGICDHSKSAVYAKGLSIERVLQQHEEIDRLNQELDGFHIFKGIESDILNDGSLDYPDEILERFDLVVASVHSNLKMDVDKATARIIKAVENPYTTILGHPTGRLLLSRKGYEIDHQKVIDACAANGVVIEINANPLRLDLDWRWHQYAIEKGVLLSINPDAHRVEGFKDMEFGILAARKGGVTKTNCLNALSLEQITAYLAERRTKRSAK
ncbi:DNA polymerase/3'-5' exonuclease PolX [Mucilaginibacter daejeonensis]|uniref:DNA polymerase/3'-5' exonuclease PolX n=1 Tax=Mucilaginibacter daejeonensis TaxID=398049 RepID=UPI001D1784AC|nr:DNA polymerase/3'-5' exonuclease PolX [Mucilaginibacter daejeonensis]UEG52333.1 DNA polymerase/3'-5' exonuclease PolX [Mucilaginibacter daejeonensis]